MKSNSSLRVAHLITTIERGGAELALLSLCHSQVKMGYRVVVIPLKGKPELADILISSGVEIDFSLIGLSLIEQFSRMQELFKDYPDYIVHAHLPRAEILASFLVRTHKVLSTRHNSEPFWPNAPFPSMSKLTSRWITRRFQCVIAITHAVRGYLEQNSELNQRLDIEVIHYGYESVVTTNSRVITSDKLASAPVIGMISRLAPQKNLNLALNFVQLLMLSGMNIQLKIVGAGPDKELLNQRCLELGLQGHVEFLGKTENVHAFLESIDVFLLTSNYEGFGRVLLEAMDANRPVLAPNNSSIPEVLGMQHEGIYESGNLHSLVVKFEHLLEQQGTISRILRYQQARLKLFTVKRCFDAHDRVYREIQF